ncbi:MAG: HEPN domain-containing protein [Methylocystaceae bacterium]|nr:MAG: HEPN domain-containing protein [Methylocystaceae bacterium]
MKPETAAFLAKAQQLLERAPLLLAQNFTDEAGRAAYLAGFHAAQAFIFERQDRSPKSHSGVQTEFARLAKDEVAIDGELRAFLGRAYNLKAIADYETGPGSNISYAQAAAAVESAAKFVEAILALFSRWE